MVALDQEAGVDNSIFVPLKKAEFPATWINDQCDLPRLLKKVTVNELVLS